MSAKPLIYIIDASLERTGALMAVKRQARCLRDEARFVLVLPAASKIRPEDVPEFERLLRLPMVSLRRSPGSMILYLPSLFYCGWRLRRALKADSCTRLQVNDFYLMQGAVARLFGFRGTLVTWVRIDPGRFGLAGKLWLRIARRVSDRLVAVSCFIRDRLAESPDLCLVYDPCPEQEPPIHPGPSASQRLVFVGNYIEGKGQDKAIAAFDRIAERFPRAQLAFFGSDMGLEKNRAYRRRLEEQVRRSPAGDRIRLGGFLSDPREALRGARGALNFSVSESFSLTCQEASACAIPVIATRCGGPEEIVEDQVTGFLVGIDDVAAMADRMARLLEDPELARQMGSRGAALVASRFSSRSFRAEIETLFGLGNT